MEEVKEVSSIGSLNSITIEASGATLTAPDSGDMLTITGGVRSSGPPPGDPSPAQPDHTRAMAIRQICGILLIRRSVWGFWVMKSGSAARSTRIK